MGKDKGYVNACACICDVLYSGVCVCEWAFKESKGINKTFATSPHLESTLTGVTKNRKLGCSPGGALCCSG